MKLKEALEYEKNREEKSSWNKIILHQDGKFYHAYEWSAWLIKAFAEKEVEGQTGLKVSLYRSTNAEYIIGGFPLESLSKFIPDYINTKPVDEKCLSVEIRIPEDYDYSTIVTDFEEWRKTCPVQESKKLQGRSQAVSGSNAQVLGRTGMFGILARVLSYPVESSTPVENMEFISRLKQDLAALL